MYICQRYFIINVVWGNVFHLILEFPGCVFAFFIPLSPYIESTMYAGSEYFLNIILIAWFYFTEKLKIANNLIDKGQHFG